MCLALAPFAVTHCFKIASREVQLLLNACPYFAGFLNLYESLLCFLHMQSIDKKAAVLVFEHMSAVDQNNGSILFKDMLCKK